MTIGILGGGFGLYGYLPALTVGLGRRVVLPTRYRDVMLGRDDIRGLVPTIDWVESDEQMLRKATALIIARRPVDQFEAIGKIANLPNLERILLEKPVAPDPARARQAVGLLLQHGKSVGVGYNFRYTAWSKRLADWIQRSNADNRLTIEWRFRAHHYVHGLDNWKRHPAQGGGALRFFGIHLIGLLAQMGYTTASRSELSGDSQDDAARWCADITGPDKPACAIAVDCNSDHSIFRLDGGNTIAPAELTIALSDPFQEAPKLGRFDRRADILIKLCKVTFIDPAGTPAWLQASLDLWDQIERQTPSITRPT